MAASQGDCRVAAEAADQFGVFSGHHHPSSIGKYFRQNPDKTSQVSTTTFRAVDERAKKGCGDRWAMWLMSLLVLAFKDQSCSCSVKRCSCS
jgi:hypothetical protein